MLNRGQFTFYRSFWEAIKVLPKKDRLPILEAIISYALDGIEPQSLSQSQLAFFSLVRPNLDSSRKKAESGKQGGKANGKQTVSKPQANGNQTESEKENEKENEKEIEIEGEKDKEQTASSGDLQNAPAPLSGKAFASFWNAYPKKIDREGAWEAWKTLNPSADVAEQIMSALAVYKTDSQWVDDGDRYIPRAAKFLREEYWKSPPRQPCGYKGIPKGASGQLGEAELENIQRLLREGAT